LRGERVAFRKKTILLPKSHSVNKHLEQIAKSPTVRRQLDQIRDAAANFPSGNCGSLASAVFIRALCKTAPAASVSPSRTGDALRKIASDIAHGVIPQFPLRAGGTGALHQAPSRRFAKSTGDPWASTVRNARVVRRRLTVDRNDNPPNFRRDVGMRHRPHGSAAHASDI